jgi:hypothetical protein
MDEKSIFGSVSASEYEIGDIVGWTTWNKSEKAWIISYGILINIENQFVSNRLVSIATVKSLNKPHDLKELFAINLKPINKLKK